MTSLLRRTTEGVLIEQPLDGGPPVCRATFTCCHCCGVWVERKGSGIRRGFCLRCCARTCGAPACDACIPVERQLECMETGVPLSEAPVTIIVPRSI